jgi:cytochrome c2
MSNKKKQNSIDWLVEELRKYIEEPWKYVPKGGKEAIVEQAKAMHKEEQREDMIGLLEWMNEIAKTDPMQLETDKDDIVDMYYNETYGGNK